MIPSREEIKAAGHRRSEDGWGDECGNCKTAWSVVERENPPCKPPDLHPWTNSGGNRREFL